MAETADWSRYNLPAIWSMMKDENVCDGADRVLGWDTLSQDVRAQHERLTAATERLAEVWPPDKNASAEAFLTQVAGLAASMKDTLTAAEDTRVGLQGIMNAIATAQSTLSPIVQERQAKSTDFVPRFVDHAEDDYDKAGQQAMRVAEAAIQDHGAQIRAPQLFTMNPDVNTTTDLPAPGKGGSSTSGSGGGSVAAVPVPVPVPHNPPDFGARGGSPGSSDGGPGLAGALPPSPGTVPPGLGGTVPPPSAGGLGGGVSAGGLPGAVIGGGAFGLGVGGASGLGVGGGFGSGVRAGAGGGRGPVSIRRGLPSGATIGAQPAEGGLGGRSMAGRESLAGGPAGGGLGGRGSPVGSSGGRSRGTGAAEDEMISGEADLRWGVRSGVEPVIEPDTTPVRHDPGPGVIGFGT